MIVAPAFAVALFPPTAHVAMTYYLRISLAGVGLHSLSESSFHNAKIGGKRGQPIGLRLESRVWPNNMEKLRLPPLQFGEQFRVEAQLKNRLRFCFAGELAIRNFVRPVTQPVRIIGPLYPK